MKSLPTVICTSVIRSSQQGESHGGMYLVNLQTRKVRQVIDWNDQTINWEGRGADRGLRGISFYEGNIIAAASNEIFMYSQDFEMIKSFRNQYLNHCHEIFVCEDMLYLSSTGYDSILSFDLKSEKFIDGYCYRIEPIVKSGVSILDRGMKRTVLKKKYAYRFDPNSQNGPLLKDTNHINNVFVHEGLIYFSGRFISHLMQIDPENGIQKSCKIPRGTHNVQRYNGGLIMNNTNGDNVTRQKLNGAEIENFDILTYDIKDIEGANIGKDHARQAFGRGLCSYEDLMIAGSSPATISVYQPGKKQPMVSVNISKDIRNSVHGLEVYPYESII